MTDSTPHSADTSPAPGNSNGTKLLLDPLTYPLTYPLIYRRVDRLTSRSNAHEIRDNWCTADNFVLDLAP